MLAEDARFLEAIVDRIDASIILFMNSTSIFMWFAGNDSGYGVNIKAALRHARILDSSRLFHYESYFAGDWKKQHLYDKSLLDVWSIMYGSFEEMDELYFLNL